MQTTALTGLYSTTDLQAFAPDLSIALRSLGCAGAARQTLTEMCYHFGPQAHVEITSVTAAIGTTFPKYAGQTLWPAALALVF